LQLSYADIYISVTHKITPKPYTAVCCHYQNEKKNIR